MTSFFDDELRGEHPSLGELPYRHVPGRNGRTVRRVLVAAGSLTAGAFAAGGAYVLVGPQDAAVSLAAAATGAPGGATADPAEARTDDTSRDADRPGMCVRLDAAALAAVDAARNGAAPTPGPTIRVRTKNGNIVLPMAAVKVAPCATPAGSPSSAGSSSAKKASARATSSTSPAGRSTTSPTSARPTSRTTTTRPSSSTTTPKSSTTTSPRTTTTTKPKPSTTSTSKSPTPKPTTSSGS